MADVDNTPAGDPDDFGTEVKIHPIGELAAALIEVIEATYGESADVGAVGIVAEVNVKVGNTTETQMMTWTNIEGGWVSAALFDEASRVVRGEQG